MLNFKIISPEKKEFSEEVDQVSLMTQDGEITVLQNHIPLVTVLKSGELRYKKNGEEKIMAVSGGFAEVRPDNTLIILADTAERFEEIDLARAEQAKERAEEAMNKARDEEQVDYTALQANLERAVNRLKIKKKYKDVGKNLSS
jgi:F-type H+-transporting ATPase subunit epsilon